MGVLYIHPPSKPQPQTNEKDTNSEILGQIQHPNDADQISHFTCSICIPHFVLMQIKIRLSLDLFEWRGQLGLGPVSFR